MINSIGTDAAGAAMDHAGDLMTQFGDAMGQAEDQTGQMGDQLTKAFEEAGQNMDQVMNEAAHTMDTSTPDVDLTSGMTATIGNGKINFNPF